MTAVLRIVARASLLAAAVAAGGPRAAAAEPGSDAAGWPEWIRVSADGSHFVGAASGRRFVAWGVNYDHDSRGARLLEDYWVDEWSAVVEDFGEMRELGVNLVRVHLQLGKFMRSETEPDGTSLERLGRLLALAGRNGLHLDLTGLGCYHRRDVPAWYDALPEARRWDVQARFWAAVARVCRDSPVVFCYDLMNEPVLPGDAVETDWLGGEFAGKHYVQRISLDLAGRSRGEVAKAWVGRLVAAIREVDRRHLVTVGVIPWAHVFKGAGPVFHSPEVAGPLDFVSVHFYPKRGDVDGALAALRVYELGKPLLVEEIFPLECGIGEAHRFIDGSRGFADGWVSFYWGRTIAECRSAGDQGGAVVAAWLESWRDRAPGRN